MSLNKTIAEVGLTHEPYRPLRQNHVIIHNAIPVLLHPSQPGVIRRSVNLRPCWVTRALERKPIAPTREGEKPLYGIKTPWVGSREPLCHTYWPSPSDGQYLFLPRLFNSSLLNEHSSPEGSSYLTTQPTTRNRPYHECNNNTSTT
jgi:hypothetical protein